MVIFIIYQYVHASILRVAVVDMIQRMLSEYPGLTNTNNNYDHSAGYLEVIQTTTDYNIKIIRNYLIKRKL